MARKIYVDPPVVRKVKMAFNEKVRCSFPGCGLRFVPVNAAKKAYMRKGFCFCHKHQKQVQVAAFYAAR